MTTRQTVFAFLLLVGINSMAFASTGALKIVCGDLQASYIGTDLSQDFLQAYLSRDQAAEYEEMGFKKAFGGRNCGLNRYDSETEFDVVVITKHRKLLIRDTLGPMGIVDGVLNLKGDVESIKNGVILTGTSSGLSNASKTVQGTLTTDRASDSSPVLVIIRSK